MNMDKETEYQSWCKDEFWITIKEKLKITKDDDYISLSKKLSILGSNS